MKNIIGLLIVTFISLNVFGQTEDISFSKAVKLSEKSYLAKNYTDAYTYLKAANSKGDLSSSQLYTLYELSKVLRKSSESVQWLTQLSEKDIQNEYTNLESLLIRAFIDNGEYQAAVSKVESIIDEVDENEVLELNYAFIGSKYGLYPENPSIEVVPFSAANSTYSEFAPFVKGENFYFSKPVVKPGSVSNAQLYQIKKSETWSSPELIPALVDSNKHIGSVSIVGDEMYFTKGTFEGEEVVKYDLYKSTLINGSWSSPQFVSVKGSNGMEMNVRHPHVVDQDKELKLFFSSDINKDSGWDIYHSEISQSGQVSIPFALNGDVNSVGDEISPYYFDETLYFSSNAHTSMGGFDLFISYPAAGKYGVPVNLGKGYNSMADDMFIRFNNDIGEGYFVSNRDPEGKLNMPFDDIYSFKILPTAQINVTVIDEAGEKVVPESISVTNVEGEMLTPKSYFSPAQFWVERDEEYIVTVSSQGKDASEKISITENKKKEIVVSLKPILLPSEDKSTKNEEVVQPKIISEGVLKFGEKKVVITPLVETQLNQILRTLKNNSSYDFEILTRVYNEPTKDQISSARTNKILGYLENVGGVSPQRLNASTSYGDAYIPGMDMTKDMVYYMFKETGRTEALSNNQVENTTVVFEQLTHDFGDVKQGDIVSYTFEFSNTGDEPYQIEYAGGSCGCTVPDFPKGPIAPGETNKIVVEFNSYGKAGEEHQSVTIIGNTEMPVIELNINVNVIE